MRFTFPLFLFLSSLSVTLAAPVEYKSVKAGNNFQISEIKRDLVPAEPILNKRDIPALTLLFQSFNNSATIDLGVTALSLSVTRDQATNFVATFMRRRGLNSTLQAADQSGLALSLVLMVLTHYETIDGAIKVVNYYASGDSCNPASPGIIGSAIDGISGVIGGIGSIIGGILGGGSSSSSSPSTTAGICRPAANVTSTSVPGGAVGNAGNGVTSGIANGVSGAANGVANGVSGVANGIASGVSDITGGNNVISGVANGVASGVSTVANGIANGVSGVANGVSNVVSGVAGGLLGLLGFHSASTRSAGSPASTRNTTSVRNAAGTAIVPAISTISTITTVPTISTIAPVNTPVSLSTSTVTTSIPETTTPSAATISNSIALVAASSTGSPSLLSEAVDGIGSVIEDILRREDFREIVEKEGLVSLMRRDDVDEVELMHQLMKRAVADIENNSSNELAKRDVVMDLIFSQIIGIIGTDSNIESIFESLQKSGLAVNVVYNALVNSGFYQFDVQLVTFLFRNGYLTGSSLLSSAYNSGLLVHLAVKILTTTSYLNLVLNFILASFTGKVRTITLVRALIALV